MNTPEYSQLPATPLGFIEPHAGLLRIPKESQLLYKVMTVENLLRSVTGNYLHFNRVDSYPDFPNVDKNDGRQLPKDQPANTSAKFEKNPKYSAAHYYDQSRARTYACCFSTQNSDYIWNNYGNGSVIGKFALKDGTLIQFQPALQLGFDFREAIANGAIREILLTPDTNSGFLSQELSKLRIEPISMPAQK